MLCTPPPAAARRCSRCRCSYVAEALYALDGNEMPFWSSVGGTVCCTESSPAWLLVALGAPRPIATLQLVVVHDMTFTLLLANASDAAWVTVATHTCVECLMNLLLEGGNTLYTFDVTRGGRPVVASHIKLLITWSSAGGMGGCADTCDWCARCVSVSVSERVH